jgi:hypothetical protein
MKNNWKHNKKVRKAITRFRRIEEILSKQNLFVCCNNNTCYIIEGQQPFTKIKGKMEDYREILKK